jgi:hypothetical protein
VAAAVPSRVPIQVGVNVTAPRKKRNIRVAGLFGQAVPADPFTEYNFAQGDCTCVSIIIPIKSRRADIINFATQMWAFTVASVVPPEILDVSHFFYPELIEGPMKGRFSILQVFGETRPTPVFNLKQFAVRKSLVD